MSIREVLEARLADKSLVLVRPIRGGSKKRKVYVTPKVFEQLDPQTASDEYSSSAGHLRAWLDGFTKGRQLRVGERRSRTCDMKRLDPGKDEVWEIRKQDQPSVRLFGRFLAKDIFIVTNMELVSNLFGVEWRRGKLPFWPNWGREIRNCKAAWRVMFYPYEPHSGSNLNDYLSGAVPESR
jgi:hypothetical protein